MKHIFNQYFGIGDIIFIEPIIRKFYQEGNEVVLPVLPKFADIQPYFPYIKIVDYNSLKIGYEQQNTVSTGDTIIHPVRWSKEWFNSPYTETMRNKYKMFNIDLEVWRTSTWLRHRWKENKLIQELYVPDEYTLINNNFHSYNDGKTFIKHKSKLPVVRMDFIKGYTLFDWATIIENATEIHSVNTSILFLLELLDLKTKEIHLYSRNVNGFDFKNTEYLRSKNYILHD